MMDKKIPCEIINDLLPMYIEDLLSNESKLLIEEHLNDCNLCKYKYESLSREMKQENMNMALNEKKEVDYLKRLRNYQKKTWILGCVISFMMGSLLPLAVLALNIIVNWGGKIPDYYFARFKIAWHIGILYMAINGFFVCAIYMAITFIFQKSKKC